MKTYELSPGKFDRVKSFYGKARIIEKDSGEKILQSYNTEVCKITPGGGIHKIVGGLQFDHHAAYQCIYRII